MSDSAGDAELESRAAAPSPSARPSGSIAAIIAAFLVWGLFNFNQSLFGYAIPGIMDEFQAGIDTIGLIITLTFLVAVPTTILCGIMADHFGRGLMLAGCTAGSGLLIALMALAGDVTTLAVLRIIGFAIGSALSPIGPALVAESAPANIRGLAVGLLQCSFPIAWFLASFLAAPLLAVYGWRSLFLCAAAGLLLAPLLYRWCPPSLGETRLNRPRLSDRLSLLLGPSYRATLTRGALVFFCFAGAYAGSAFFLPAYFEATRGYDLATAIRIIGYGYGVGTFGYVASAVCGQWGLGLRRTAIVWSSAGAASFLTFLWLPTSEWEDILTFSLVAIFFYGLAAVLSTYIVESFPAEIRATGVSLSASIGMNLGFAVFPIIVPILVTQMGWQWAFTIAIAPALIICAILLALGPADRPQRRRGTSAATPPINALPKTGRL